MSRSTHTRDASSITLRSLIAARWVLIGLSTLAAALVWGLGPRLPAGLLPRSDYGLALVLVLLGWAGHNLVSRALLRRERASERLAGLHLSVDALMLTALLAFSGGPANPFTIVYFLPITLATLVSPRWTWTLAGLCMAGFAALFVVTPSAPPPRTADPHHAPAPVHHGGAHHPAPHHEHGRADADNEHFEGHQRGMWVAFGIAGALMTIFVHRTALALAAQREELARLRRQALEDRHVTALGSLAAGAAHELGTPLGTVRMLVDELPHLDAGELDEAQATMREQLGRCKTILARMVSPDLRVAALGGGEPWPLRNLLASLPERELDVPIELQTSPQLEQQPCSQPLGALTQLLRELLTNAADATRRAGEPFTPIELRFEQVDARLRVTIRDAGVGMDADTRAAAFDPFHTTRAEGEGMGLGLYLARAHLRQLGGSITLDSTPGRGTTVEVELPSNHGGAKA